MIAQKRVARPVFMLAVTLVVATLLTQSIGSKLQYTTQMQSQQIALEVMVNNISCHHIDAHLLEFGSWSESSLKLPHENGCKVDVQSEQLTGTVVVHLNSRSIHSFLLSNEGHVANMTHELTMAINSVQVYQSISKTEPLEGSTGHRIDVRCNTHNESTDSLLQLYAKQGSVSLYVQNRSLPSHLPKSPMIWVAWNVVMLDSSPSLKTGNSGLITTTAAVITALLIISFIQAHKSQEMLTKKLV